MPIPNPDSQRAGDSEKRTGGRVVRVVRQCLCPTPDVVTPLKLLLAAWRNKVEGGNYAGGGYGSDLPPGLHLTGPPAHGRGGGRGVS